MSRTPRLAALAVALPLVSALLLAGCSDDDIDNAAQQVKDVSASAQAAVDGLKAKLATAQDAEAAASAKLDEVHDRLAGADATSQKAVADAKIAIAQAQDVLARAKGKTQAETDDLMVEGAEKVTKAQMELDVAKKQATGQVQQDLTELSAALVQLQSSLGNAHS